MTNDRLIDRVLGKLKVSLCNHSPDFIDQPSLRKSIICLPLISLIALIATLLRLESRLQLRDILTRPPHQHPVGHPVPRDLHCRSGEPTASRPSGKLELTTAPRLQTVAVEIPEGFRAVEPGRVAPRSEEAEDRLSHETITPTSSSAVR